MGSKVGKYEIVRKLGQGGMGRVYEALNPTIGKRVAIKLLDPRLASNESAAARFTREARAASAASSPHIVEIFDAGIADDGTPFIVMQLLEGEPLSARLDREGKLAPEEAVRIVVQVLRGLVKAHEAGIVHRDLKPDNIFLVDRDHELPFAKILDFGVSKVDRKQSGTTLTREGTVLGTPAYMSPEQAQGEADVDARSDVWSIGAILYECLSGKQPFSGTTYEQIIVRICTTTPPPIAELAPEVPGHLVSIVERCMRRDRDRRIGSAAELLALLGGDERPSSATVVGRPREAPSIGTDSTIEARGVMLDDAVGTASPLSRYAVAAALLVACAALVMWSRTRAEERTAETAPAVAPAAPEPTPEAKAPEAPEPAAEPSGSAEADEAAGGAGAAAGAGGAPPAPSGSAAVPRPETPRPRPLARPSPAPPPTSTPAPEPPEPRGVAGHLGIQRDE